MRTLTAMCVVVIAGAVGVAAGGASPAAKKVSLTITYWPNEQAPESFQRWTLRCNPIGGTLAGRVRACSRLSRLPLAAFAQVPEDAICTQIYGGPQRIVVTGTVEGDPVTAEVTRANGCEIDRYDRLAEALAAT